MPHAICPPLSPNPPRLEWIARCAGQLMLRDAAIDEEIAREEAAGLYEVSRGEYTPEEAADVATGFLQPLHEAHLHLFELAFGSLGDEG